MREHNAFWRSLVLLVSVGLFSACNLGFELNFDVKKYGVSDHRIVGEWKMLKPAAGKNLSAKAKVQLDISTNEYVFTYGDSTKVARIRGRIVKSKKLDTFYFLAKYKDIDFGDARIAQFAPEIYLAYEFAINGDTLRVTGILPAEVAENKEKFSCKLLDEKSGVLLAPPKMRNPPKSSDKVSAARESAYVAEHNAKYNKLCFRIVNSYSELLKVLDRQGGSAEYQEDSIVLVKSSVVSGRLK